ncbi:TonB-dependent receptor [Sediminitomix flava]|uniref:Iron complex outermembrane receptor protein n=1 Tax=Sediminitomix flava TaxID=379075 RepID=A0A315ZFG7_SEDFL|nr:TonB-dependent receptor [Sediminitomix flava]PWJ43913.1 iron complex outermembrane receptor protein [Sediminitomix flava]
MRKVLLILFSVLLLSEVSIAQEEDSLNIHFLDEIEVESSLNTQILFHQQGQMDMVEGMLEKHPSMQMIRRGNYAQEPIINSLSSGQINVSIDGMRIFGACTDKMDPVTSYIEINNLSEAVIHSDHGSQKIGSNLGGSLDLKLQDIPTSAEPFSGTLRSKYSSNTSGQDYQAVLNYQTEKWKIRYSGSLRMHENYTDGNGNEIQYSQYNKTNHAISTSLINKSEGVWNATFILDEAWDIGYPALPMDVSTASGKIFGVGYKQKNLNSIIDRLEAKIYANQITHIMDDTQREDVAIHMDMPGWSTTYGSYLELEGMKGKHHWNMRADVYSNEVRAEMTMYPENAPPSFMLTWPDTRRTVSGLFLEDRLHFSPSLELYANVRADLSHTQMLSEMGRGQFENFNYVIPDVDHRFIINGLIGTSLDLSENLNLNLSLAKNERLSSVSELYGFYLFNSFDGFDYIGNPDLENERAIQFSSQLSYQKRSLSLSLKAFNYWVSNTILGVIEPDYDRMTIGANGVKSYQNIGNSMLTGLQFGSVWKPIKALEWNVTASYQKGELENGEPLPFIQPFTLQNTLFFRHENLFTQLDYTFAATQNQINTDVGEVATSSYHLINLRIGFEGKLATNNYRVEGGIDNLTDTAYRNHLDWGGINRMGRNIHLGLSYYF